MDRINILVVGQTPPPYHGQAIMIQKMLEGNYKSIKLFHVRMSFSNNIGEVGRFRLNKIVESIKLITKIILARFRFNSKILYYPPSGPNTMAIIRDIVILISTRWLFSKVIFHFEGGGLGEFYMKTPRLYRPLFRFAYFKPDAAIHLTNLSPNDGGVIKAKKIYVVPNGIEDLFSTYSTLQLQKVQNPVILFVGALYKSKGVFDLLEAGRILKDKGYNFCIKIMGEGSLETVQDIQRFIISAHLNNNVELLGVRVGGDKWIEYATSDIFCFPSYYEAESFPVVILEALMFGLPVVASKWRGIPRAVRDGENGFLVPIQSPEQLAEKLRILVEDENLRKRMGLRGREIFMNEFTINKFWDSIERVFVEVAMN